MQANMEKDQQNMKDEFSSLFLQDHFGLNLNSQTQLLSTPNVLDDFEYLYQQQLQQQQQNQQQSDISALNKFDECNTITPLSMSASQNQNVYSNQGALPHNFNSADFTNGANWQTPQFSHYSSLIPIEATAPIPTYNYNTSNVMKYTNANFPDNLYSPIIPQVVTVSTPVIQEQPALAPISSDDNLEGIKSQSQRESFRSRAKSQYKPAALPSANKEEVANNEYTELLDFDFSTTSSDNFENKLIDFNDHEVNYVLRGFLNGKFFTNEEVFDKKIVSCYRRNYILVNFSIDFNSQIPYKLYNNDLITKFKVSIFANINLSDEKIEVLIFEDKKSVASDENLDVEYIDVKEFDIPIEEIKNCNNYIIKKLQFKHATPNNGKLNFQNYYHLVIKISCVTTTDEVFELNSIKSKPIIVRGRNPSFYTEKNDILIPNKTVNMKQDKPPNNNSISSPELTTTDVLISEEKPQNEVPVNRSSRTASSSSSTSTTSDSDSYKYFPIESAYYLPPINVVYFPHGAHHPRQSDMVRRRVQYNTSTDGDNSHRGEAESSKKTIIRNYYFKS